MVEEQHSITAKVHYDEDCKVTFVNVDFIYDEGLRVVTGINIQRLDLDYADLEAEVREAIIDEVGYFPMSRRDITFA